MLEQELYSFRGAATGGSFVIVAVQVWASTIVSGRFLPFDTQLETFFLPLYEVQLISLRNVLSQKSG